MYDFRAAGIGQDPDGRPDLPKPSLVLTAGEAFRVPGEYVGSLLLDAVTDRVRRPATSARAGRCSSSPASTPRDTVTKRLRGHLGAPRLGRLRLGRRHQPRAHRRGPRRGAGPVRRGATATTRSRSAWSAGASAACWCAGWRSSGPSTCARSSPSARPGVPRASGPGRTRMFERSRRTHGLSDRAEAVVDELREPLLVFSTAIYSKTDGIVPWRGCALDDGPARRRTSRCPSSHIGLVSNPLVLAVVTDRLAQDPDAPVPFSWRRPFGGRRDRQEGRAKKVAAQEGAGEGGRPRRRRRAKRRTRPRSPRTSTCRCGTRSSSARRCRSCGW